MAGYVDASLANSNASSLSQDLNTATTINFGNGVIDNPNSDTNTQTQTPTATSSLAGPATSNTAGGSTLPGGITITKETGEIIVAIIAGLVLIGFGAFLLERKIL